MKKNKQHIFRFGEICRSQWKNASHVVVITTLAILLAKFVIYDLMSLSAFAPLEKASDFQMSDIYHSVSASGAIHHLSSDIIIIGVDGYSREQVLDAINLISDYSPAAIGVDIFFLAPEKDNSYLLNTFSSVPNLVCAGRYEKENETESYHHLHQSFYEDSINVTFGYVNLNASSQRDVIRDFTPFEVTIDNDTLFSLPAQLTRLYSPKKYKKLINRKNPNETIAFDNNEFTIIPIQDILDENVNSSLISNKVILIGDVKNIGDTHLVPLHDSMPGVLIHAYALQTILSDNYIDSTTAQINWLIAVILCIIFAICNLLAKYKMSNMGNLFMRIAQFVIIYILIIVGSKYYASQHSYIDFSPAVLAIGFGAIAFDVWFGCIALYNFIKNKSVKK